MSEKPVLQPALLSIEPWGDWDALPTVLQTTSHDKLKRK